MYRFIRVHAHNPTSDGRSLSCHDTMTLLLKLTNRQHAYLPVPHHLRQNHVDPSLRESPVQVQHPVNTVFKLTANGELITGTLVF